MKISFGTRTPRFRSKLLSELADWLFIGALVTLGFDGPSKRDLWIRVAGAVAWLFIAVMDAFDNARRRKTGTPFSGAAISIGTILMLLMSFDRATSHPKGAPYPFWLVLLGAAIGLLIVAAIPFGVASWRAKKDERERAIANGSMAFAFLVTMVFVVALYLVHEMRIAVTFDPSWIIAAASVSWFGAYFVLQRRM